MLTARQLASQIGCSIRTVQRIGTRYGIGTQLDSGVRVYSQADVARVKAHVHESAGNPNFVKGNYFGQVREDQ